MIASRFNALRAAACIPLDLFRKLGEVVITMMGPHRSRDL